MARDIRRIAKREIGPKEPFSTHLRRVLSRFLLGTLLALSAGALTGVLAAYYLNNSRYSVEVSALATYRPPQVTTIYADDGETVDTLMIVSFYHLHDEPAAPTSIAARLIAEIDERGAAA